MMTLVQVFRNISVVSPIHSNKCQCDDPEIPVYVRIIHDRIRTAKNDNDVGTGGMYE